MIHIHSDIMYMFRVAYNDFSYAVVIVSCVRFEFERLHLICAPIFDNAEIARILCAWWRISKLGTVRYWLYQISVRMRGYCTRVLLHVARYGLFNLYTISISSKSMDAAVKAYSLLCIARTITKKIESPREKVTICSFLYVGQYFWLWRKNKSKITKMVKELLHCEKKNSFICDWMQNHWMCWFMQNIFFPPSKIIFMTKVKSKFSDWYLKPKIFV